jgi:hypothetical protein
VLPRGQPGQRAPSPREELPHHLGIDDAATGRDPLERLEELVHVQDPILSRYPTPPASVDSRNVAA